MGSPGSSLKTPNYKLEEFLSRPASARPALLEGRWLDDAPGDCWAASDPSALLEGSLEAFNQLPEWLDDQSRKYPQGAAIGYFSYELARHFEAVTLSTDPSLPDASFAYYPRIDRFPVGPADFDGPGALLSAPSPVGFPAYAQAAEKIRSYIAAGDIYQANLTIPFFADLKGQSPESVYRRMRTSGAPFRAFLKTPGRTILSNSPERFFRVTGHHILASPIKGTIARDRENPLGSEAALVASEKDRAENLMIVDLLRNDLGRICHYSSIKARLWEKEVLPQLIHLVSHVEGTLLPVVGIGKIIQALFPCGSITGAPKIRAMEILAEIEQAPRGISMGAIGIIRNQQESGGVRMDFNVAIRTMVIVGEKATFNVGGGIVYDSDPAAEYAEVMLKAQPLFEALGIAAK